MRKKLNARISNVILSTLAEQDAQAVRDSGSDCTLTVTIGNTDLPAFVSGGRLYIQAPLPHVFRAFAEDLSEFISDMEIRVSTAGGASLSLDSDGYPVSGAPVAFQSLVSGGGQF